MSLPLAQCNAGRVIVAAGEYKAAVNTGWEIIIGKLQAGMVVKALFLQIIIC